LDRYDLLVPLTQTTIDDDDDDDED